MPASVYPATRLPARLPFAPPLITVFGGSGFIGRAIVALLARQPIGLGGKALQRPRIRVVTRSMAAAEPLRLLGDVGQIEPFVCNPADPAAIAAALSGADAVVNCIGILAEGGRAKFAALHGELPGLIASELNRALAERSRDIPFVHLSAIGADANSPSAYARSKAAGEGVVRALYPAAMILRPSVVFGPDDRFFNRFASLALLSPLLPLFGRADLQLQPVFVGDVAAAVRSALSEPAARGATFELGGPEILSLRQVLQTVLRLTMRRRWIVAIPNVIAVPLAGLLERLPGRALTRDQLRLLERDNVASHSLPGLAQLGVRATALDGVLPGYLARYRPAALQRQQ